MSIKYYMHRIYNNNNSRYTATLLRSQDLRFQISAQNLAIILIALKAELKT